MADPCALHFRFCPAQAGFGAQFGTGVISTDLPGGLPWSRLDTTGNVHRVPATWVLGADDYCEFMGFVRNWENSGGDPFTVDLRLETPDTQTYEATFEVGTIALQSINGNAFTVAGTLLVMPLFLDPCTDECAARATVGAIFGDDICEMIDLLDHIVSDEMNATGN